ncbi:MAG: hypothetical protein BMS9Abin36_1246 [Gammaproteobacteria bacterium]|nr:MAG: hypothetical protein BMS9Abin36_1246 [Gammaproteobacteria bacterium]
MINRPIHAAQALDAEIVMANDHTVFRVDWMSFAEYRTSILGIGGIPCSMEEIRQDKIFVNRT